MQRYHPAKTRTKTSRKWIMELHHEEVEKTENKGQQEGRK
jgi:hypothetical protein